MPHKYREELHCNELMLLPYYVASMNIEHAFWEATGGYEAFEGICLVDTFETAEKEQRAFDIFNEANTERVERQRKAPIKVIIANPPYNAGQVNENDNNKNRKYEEIDRRVRVTYAADSKATLVRKLSDPYVKAIRFAADRIGDAGVVCYVNNDSFVAEKTFRRHAQAPRAGLRPDLRPGAWRQRPQEPEALRHDPQCLRHPGRSQHQSVRPPAEKGRRESGGRKSTTMPCRSIGGGSRNTIFSTRPAPSPA